MEPSENIMTCAFGNAAETKEWEHRAALEAFTTFSIKKVPSRRKTVAERTNILTSDVQTCFGNMSSPAPKCVPTYCDKSFIY